MVPKIYSGELCIIAPRLGPVVKDDIVLCKVNGNYYLHLVSAVREGQVQISNNKGHVNGWTGLHNVFGILVSVEK